jgi:hypothetical protein
VSVPGQSETEILILEFGRNIMAGDLSELLFLAIGWFGWKSAATAFFASVVALFLLNVRSGELQLSVLIKPRARRQTQIVVIPPPDVDAKTSYRTVLARRRANPQEMEYTLAITTGFFLFMIVVPAVADMIGL